MSEPKEDIALPFIEGDIISLCAMNLDRISLYVAWMNNPKIRKYAGYNMPQTIEDVKKKFEPKKEAVKEEIFFEIWQKEDKKPIGYGGFLWIEWFTRNAYMFYLIDPDYWGQYIGTEAGKLIIEYGFKELNLHKITTRLYAPNKASLRVAEKIGLTHEITLQKEVYIDGKHIDALEYSIFKEDFVKSQ